jgi:hypothetical protein
MYATPCSANAMLLVVDRRPRVQLSCHAGGLSYRASCVYEVVLTAEGGARKRPSRDGVSRTR